MSTRGVAGWAGLVAAVAAGGALGALLRVSVVKLSEGLGVPAWAGVAIANGLGGLGIGVAFVHLEARFLRHARSRLFDSPHAASIEARGWLLDADSTLDPVDLFRAEARLRRLSGFWVTGLLGGFTTFSSFALEMFELAGSLPFARFALIYAAAACVPVVTTVAGLVLGAWTLPRATQSLRPSA